MHYIIQDTPMPWVSCRSLVPLIPLTPVEIPWRGVLGLSGAVRDCAHRLASANYRVQSSVDSFPRAMIKTNNHS